MRSLSSIEEGLAVLRRMLGRQPIHYVGKSDVLNDRLKRALLVGMIGTFAQGLALLKAASDTYKFDLSVETVARIWRGSVLRSPVLQHICDALHVQPHLLTPMLDSQFEHQMSSRVRDLVAVLRLAAGLGIPTPALTASLAYYRSNRRPDPNTKEDSRASSPVFFGGHEAAQIKHEILRTRRSVL